MEHFSEPSSPQPVAAEHRDQLEERQPPLDQLICALATSQHGVITRAQIIKLGATVPQIEFRVRSSRLVEIARGVYGVGHGAIGRLGRVNAVMLQAGAGNCAVSHISAARAWDMVDGAREGDIHLSVRNRVGLETPNRTTLHRPRNLKDDEIETRYDLPTTTPERTLRDLLATSSVVEITRMLERMVTVLNRSPDALHAWAPTLPPVRGRGKLFDALEDLVGPALLRSELEAQFRSLCQKTGIALPETNARLGRWEVDVLWRELRLVIELDSWKFHGGRWQFHRDREKGLELADLGYEVLRLTWRQVKYDQAAVGQRLARIMARRALETGAAQLGQNALL